MKAEIISIGTEILLGHIINTNAAYLSKKLACMGIDLYHQSTVGDNPGRLNNEIKTALKRSDIVLTSGGLGPTVDDITIGIIGGVCSRELQFTKGILARIKKYFAERGLKSTPPDARKQAYIPRGAGWFENSVGTAPGVVIKEKGSLIIALPGPPRELEPMVENYVIPYLKKAGYLSGQTIRTKVIRTTGLVESRVNNKVKDLLGLSGKTTVGIYAYLGGVDLKITSKADSAGRADKNIKPVENKIKRRLKQCIFGEDDDTLEGVIGKMLLDEGKTISIAESCTGGLISDRITNVSGSSNYFQMGIIAYSNDVKISILGVPKKALDEYGAVSGVISQKMANGVRGISGTDMSLGITGLAGPTGGSKLKPVGLVYITLLYTNKCITRKHVFTGSREEIKWQASQAALTLVWNKLKRPR